MEVDKYFLTEEEMDCAFGDVSLNSLDEIIDEMKTSDWTRCITIFSRVEDYNENIKSILRMKLRDVYESREIIDNDASISLNIKRYLALGLSASERSIWGAQDAIKNKKLKDVPNIQAIRENAKSVVQKIDYRFKRLLDVVYGKVMAPIDVPYSPEFIKSLGRSLKTDSSSKKATSSSSAEQTPTVLFTRDEEVVVDEVVNEVDDEVPLENVLSIAERLRLKHKESLTKVEAREVIEMGLDNKITGTLDSTLKGQYVDYYTEALNRVDANIAILTEQIKNQNSIKYRIKKKLSKAKKNEEDVDFEFLNILKEDKCLLCLVTKP